MLFSAIVDSAQMLRRHVEATEIRFEAGNKRFKKARYYRQLWRRHYRRDYSYCGKESFWGWEMKYENNETAVRHTALILIGNSSFFLMPICNCQVAEMNSSEGWWCPFHGWVNVKFSPLQTTGDLTRREDKIGLLICREVKGGGN